MKSLPQLVDLEELKTLMTGVELNDAKLNAYINARWLRYVEWWDARSRSAKTKYQWMRGAVVVAGALIPAFVGLRELIGPAHAWLFAVASIVASLVVAILAGGYAQFESHQQAYKLFAQNVEDLIRHEIKDYILAVSPKQGAPSGPGKSSGGGMGPVDDVDKGAGV